MLVGAVKVKGVDPWRHRLLHSVTGRGESESCSWLVPGNRRTKVDPVRAFRPASNSHDQDIPTYFGIQVCGISVGCAMRIVSGIAG